MINRNQAAQLRTCERIKFDQALYILTMYQKKLRVPLTYDPHIPIDAQQQYQDRILKSWNKKWQSDLTKPILNCVTSIHPRVLYDCFNDKMTNQNAQHYNNIMENFIKRLKTEHEDEDNLKIFQEHIDDIWVPDHKKGKIFIMETLTHFIKTIKAMTTQMIGSIQKKQEMLYNLQDNSYSYNTASILNGILGILTNFQEKLQKNDQLMQFMYSTMKMFEDIKQSEHGSTLLCAQPDIQDFTYLVHPLFLPIYANLKRQKEQLKRKHDRKQQNRINHPQKIQQQNTTAQNQANNDKPFRNLFSSNTSSLSKTVFLNLDGYESQYNLQFARCFRKNMMYISFPKQDTHSKNDDNAIYQKRFYKKLMYNYQKNVLKSYQSIQNNNMAQTQHTMQDQINSQMNQKYSLMNDPQEYYTNVQNNLYQFQKGYEDLNKNAYIFPLRLHSLQQNFNHLKEDNDQILEIYESDVVMEIFRYFLINQIRQFNPTYIVVSYSGKLRILDQHFVQIMQQLTKISHYKVVMFPNMTASFYSSSINYYDVNTRHISYMKQRSLNNYQKQQQMQRQQPQRKQTTQLQFSLFNKIARFLKIGSGTYNLTKYSQQGGILTKFKNLTVIRKINRLMEVLGQQYEKIQKIRFKNKEIDLIPKLYEKHYYKICKTFSKLVPRYYNDLYDVIEAMIAIHLNNQQNKNSIMKLFAQFNISIDGVMSNLQIKTLIEEITDKIVIRHYRNQEQKQKLLYQNVIKSLKTEKEKHFMEIAQEKYDQFVLLYFRFRNCWQLYEESHQKQINLKGLIDISFMNPSKQARQTLHIYESTQILYSIDQRQDYGPIPILIMNHLPLDKKYNPKFDNYCALLNRKSITQIANTKNDKIPQIRKQRKIFPIKLFNLDNQQINQNRFQFRVQWNYLQTERYMILYWPSMYNMIEAVCCKIMGKNYQPVLVNQFFIAEKKTISNFVHFYQAALPQDISPRSGCTAYAQNNQIYIFGGFYDRSRNYLDLQKDITRVNIEHYDQEHQRKLQVVNQKDNLFPIIGPQYYIDDDENTTNRNSYVRTKQQYQFYDIEQICQNYQQQPQIKTVLMIGGYGQNFIHPYSMITYYYYLLKFRRDNNMLISIEKKLIYNNTVPINIRQYSKNMGIIKTSIRSRSKNNEKNITNQLKLTQIDSYAKFRVVYRLNAVQNKFDYKFQFMFSEKDIKLYKEQLRKINDEKTDTGAISDYRMEKIQGLNHRFLIDKFGSKQIVHLKLKSSELLPNDDNVLLNSQSVVYLNIINGNSLFAILQHPIYTNSKTIIVECKDKTIQTNNQNISYVTVSPITDQFIQGDLSLHVIQARNINFVYVLHGHRIFESDKICQYQIINHRRDKSKGVSQIKPKEPIFPQQFKLRCCYSVFLYNITNVINEIVCESYVTAEGSNTIYEIIEKFEPMDANNLRWVLASKPIPYLFCLKSESNPIRLDRATFLQVYKQYETKTKIIVILYNRKKYIVRLEDRSMQNIVSEIHLLMQQISEQQIRKLDELVAQKAIILHKKPDNYIDRGYVNSDMI